MYSFFQNHFIFPATTATLFTVDNTRLTLKSSVTICITTAVWLYCAVEIAALCKSISYLYGEQALFFSALTRRLSLRVCCFSCTVFMPVEGSVCVCVRERVNVWAHTNAPAFLSVLHFNASCSHVTFVLLRDYPQRSEQ